MSFFKKTNAKIFAKPTQKATPDTAYWKKLGAPVLLKEFGAIDCIDFSPVEPHYFAASCSARVQIYNPITKEVHKTLSRFRETAYGGVFRSDGELLTAGSEDAQVRVFLVESKSVLRIFNGHTGPVHRCAFTCDKQQVASFSDDKSVRLWDLSSAVTVAEFSGHKDYIRAGVVSPVSPHLILSGCYDKKLRLFDARSGSEPVLSADHGHAVESVLFLPSAGVFISAGGTEVRVWDALAGGRLLARICQHHKTVTCLGLASNATRLLSGSLDRHLKIYDIATYKPVHNIDFSNSILSIAVSPNDETLAVGGVDGIISVQRRELEEEVEEELTKKGGKASYRYYSDRVRSIGHKPDSVVKHEGKQLQSKSDVCLRKFQYSKALDVVLAPYVSIRTPNVTVSLLQELIRRKGLENALSTRPDKSIAAFLRFLIRHIGEQRFTSTLIDVANIFLDVYEKRLDGASAEVLQLVKRLRKKVAEEELLTQQLVNIGGVIQMILAASVAGEAPPLPTPTLLTNHPADNSSAMLKPKNGETPLQSGPPLISNPA